MVLRSFVGKTADQRVMELACEAAPSLIIDCANCADPHLLMHVASAETLSQVYALHVDLLYSYRDLLFLVPQYVRELGIRCVCITSTRKLFTYHDEEENWDLLLHTWILLKAISRYVPVFLALSEKSKDLPLAKKYSDVLDQVD